MKTSLPRWRAAWESAYRTFFQAALPAFGATVAATSFSITRDAVLAAAVGAVGAGVAAVMRIYRPLRTDAPNIHVEGVPPR